MSKVNKVMKFIGVLSTWSILIVFAGCNQSKEEATQAPPEITVVEVIQKDVPIYNNFVGQIYGQEDVAINARVEGFLMGIHFDEGTRVEKGKLLYSIDPEPFKAAVANENSKVAEAQTRLVNAENELARYKPLAEINAVSKSDLDYAQASRDASEASLSAAKASLRMAEINLGYTSVKSPISGFIGKTQARIGDFVGRSPNPVILNTVSKIESVRVQFFITESQYLLLAREYSNRQDLKEVAELSKEEEEEARGQAELRLILSDGSMHPYEGAVDFINREVDASTGAILIQASFPNPELILRPGQFTRVRIMMNMAKGALLVPQRCAKEIQGQYSVFVVTADNIVETRQIEVSERIGDLYLVGAGLEPGEQVVIDALQKVGSGMQIVPEKVVFESKSSIE
mgnify:CR=1 FL=1